MPKMIEENYPSKTVRMWLDNEPATYHECNAIAQECFEDAMREVNCNLEEYNEMHVISTIADLIEQNFRELNQAYIPEDSSCMSDLIEWLLDQVDWREIAESYLAEVDTTVFDGVNI